MARPPLRIAFFGKGGTGKSTLCANLAVVYAKRGLKLLVVGCDPKHDTTIHLTRGRRIPTVLESPNFMGGPPSRSDLVYEGILGIDCVEAGGPEPGIGCAGRGIARMSELLKEAGVVGDRRYDVLLYDVLGDVVCGGFATPLREGFAEKIVIVTSEEVMSLYAANNIARAIRNNRGRGNALVGLVVNLRDPKTDKAVISRFAARLGTRVLQFIQRDPLVREAEYREKTVTEHAPSSRIAGVYRRLAAVLDEAAADPSRVPTPMEDEEFRLLARSKFKGSPAGSAGRVSEAKQDAKSTPPPPAVQDIPWHKFLVAARRDPAQGLPRWLAEEVLNAQACASMIESLSRGWGAFPRTPRSVSLVGLPEGRAGDESAALLERAGLLVKARLSPRLGAEQARSFLEGESFVLQAFPALEDAWRGVLERFGIEPHRLDLPLGLGLSRRWLLKIAEPLGACLEAQRAWRDWEEANRPSWEEGLREARGMRFAFVAEPEEASSLMGGGESPLALVKFVLEMGFGVDILLFAQETEGFQVPSEGRLRVRRFSSPRELDALLTEGDFQAVFSDFPLDERIAHCGKAQLSLPQFEVGPEGALRTQRRLLALRRHAFA